MLRGATTNGYHNTQFEMELKTILH